MKNRIEVHLSYRQLTVGERCQKVLERFHRQPTKQRIYRDDGVILVPPTPHDTIDLHRSVNFFDRYVSMHAFQHWPKVLKDAIWQDFRKKDERARKFSDQELFIETIKKEDRQRYHVEDPLAVSTFLWSKFRPTVSGPDPQEKAKAIEGTKYFFSRLPLPLAKHIGYGL